MQVRSAATSSGAHAHICEQARKIQPPLIASLKGDREPALRNERRTRAVSSAHGHIGRAFEGERRRHTFAPSWARRAHEEPHKGFAPNRPGITEGGHYACG